MPTDDVIFVGRLGTYKYYNMDQVVGQALATFRRMGVVTETASPDRTAAKSGRDTAALNGARTAG